MIVSYLQLIIDNEQTLKVEIEKIKNQFPQKPLIVVTNKIDKLNSTTTYDITNKIDRFDDKINLILQKNNVESLEKINCIIFCNSVK